MSHQAVAKGEWPEGRKGKERRGKERKGKEGERTRRKKIETGKTLNAKRWENNGKNRR